MNLGAAVVLPGSRRLGAVEDEAAGDLVLKVSSRAFRFELERVIGASCNSLHMHCKKLHPYLIFFPRSFYIVSPVVRGGR